MEIVHTSSKTLKKKEIGIEQLLVLKAELKEKILNQEQLIIYSTRKLVSVASLTSYVFGSVKKKFNLVDGFLIGYKIIRSIMRFFRSRK